MNVQVGIHNILHNRFTYRTHMFIRLANYYRPICPGNIDSVRQR